MSNTEKFKGAVLYENADSGKVRCNLCNFRCLIADGKLGNCGVRKNIEGVLYSLNYDKVCAAAVDPIEKKPLFHFLPGSESFSVACVGCNFKCDFCQNWQISQVQKSGMIGSSYSAQQIVSAAIDNKCRSISYTYTEPTIFMELASDCGRLAKQKGLENIFVSNGYMTIEAVDFAKDWLSAINIDLKSFNDGFYKRVCKASLEPVLDTIKYITERTDMWLELTTLIVPDQNDSDDEIKDIADFIASLRDGNVPWHVSRFYPNYNMDGVGPTSEDTMLNAYRTGKEAGIKHVYIGNMPSGKGQNTLCPDCGKVVIERSGYRIGETSIEKGCCKGCGGEISGIF